MAAKRKAPAREPHTWDLKTRFRRRAFGWKSQPAITRVKQAIVEVKKVAKRDGVLAAEGAVLFLERVSPALEQVDSSSGSTGAAVNHAIAELVPIIANAAADDKTRQAWLERLFEAHQADAIPYIEWLADHWGELCVSKALASHWADRLLGSTRMALSSDEALSRHFHGTAACLSALYRAERFDELVALLSGDTIWPYKRWAVRAMVARGQRAEALRYAESFRRPWALDSEIDVTCEEILLASGLHDEAYVRYGLRVNQAGTYLATFRVIATKYPHKAASEILRDLAESTPGQEGKWFAAAKDAGLYDDALAIASRTPCEPKTLARAARDYAEQEPAFAVGAGLLALHWLAQGHGYEVTSDDVWAAYRATLVAAERQGSSDAVKARVRTLVAGEQAGGLVARVLRREVEL